jgi:hypothetical protein
MKTIRNILLLFAMVIFTSCMDEYTEEFVGNSPIYLSYEDLRASIKKTDAQDLVNPGKIYFKDDYLFVNEEFKGIHIINIGNPENPENIGFIEIPGNVDMVIKNNTLFADSYIDLIAIDISDVANPKVIKRVEDVLPYTLPPIDEGFKVGEVDETNGVVARWETKKIRQEMEYNYYPYYRFGVMEDAAFSNLASKGSGAVGGGAFGVGGSMARFGLYYDYLYAVDRSELHIFDVRNTEDPKEIAKQSIGWDVETMFIYDGHMFFGTQTGMLIFSLEVATVPNYIGQFRHVTSCDPVVIADGYAYVTLRGGTRCGSNVNRLDVLKLSDSYTENELLASYPLHGPYGLGIDDQTLFVCDGDAGLKVYDVTDKFHVDDHKIANFSNINTFDVIPFNDCLFMIGEDGFYQYDYSDLNNISQISFIPVKKEN